MDAEGGQGALKGFFTHPRVQPSSSLVKLYSYMLNKLKPLTYCVT